MAFRYLCSTPDNAFRTLTPGRNCFTSKFLMALNPKYSFDWYSDYLRKRFDDLSEPGSKVFDVVKDFLDSTSYKNASFGICQVVFPKMFNCSEPLKLRTGALPLRFATPGYFQNMNRGRNVAEFDSIAPTVQGGIPMTANVNREGSACAQGPFAIQSWARRACPGSATGFRRACSPIRGH